MRLLVYEKDGVAVNVETITNIARGNGKTFITCGSTSYSCIVNKPFDEVIKDVLKVVEEHLILSYKE